MLGVFFLTAAVSALASSETLSLPFGLAQRSSSERCALTWKSSGTLWCLSAAASEEWLSMGSPRSFTGAVNRTSTEDGTQILRVQEVLDRVAPSFWVERNLAKIERARHQLSQILHASDSLGLNRKLLLHENTKPSVHFLLRKMGFVHLLSAAGIHLYALFFFLERLGLWISQTLNLRSSSVRRVIFSIGFLIVFALWTLSGWRFGFLRPAWIFVLRSWARERGVRWRWFAPLLIGVGLEVLFTTMGLLEEDPWRELGRWHYALAVLGGLLVLESRGIIGHLKMSFASWICVAPFEWFADHWVAYLTPVLSLLTIPLFAQVFYPVWILVLLTMDPPVIQLWSAFQNELLRFLLWMLSELPLGFVVSPGVASLVLLSVAVRRFFRLKWSLPIVLFLGQAWISGRSTPEVVQLSVGQGDSALVKSSQVGLIDTGSGRGVRLSERFSQLTRAGVTALEFVLLTHLDEDHSGALQGMMFWIPIQTIGVHPETIWTDRLNPLRSQAAQMGVLVESVLNWGSFFPGRIWSDPVEEGGRRNGQMNGVWIPLSENAEYLAAGDADESAETRYRAWLDRLPERRERVCTVRIWKLSHHGSKSSSSLKFLRELAPTAVWLSVGERNGYGHPARAVLQNVDRLGVPLRRTDEDGDLRSSLTHSFFQRDQPIHSNIGLF